MSDFPMQNAWRAFQAGNLGEAARQYQEILRANPRNFDALYLLGFVYFQGGQFANAERALGAAVAVNPSSAEAFWGLAAALERLNRYDEALACHDRALAIKPDNAESWKARGILLSVQQRNGEALESFDRALNLQPSHPEAWERRAYALFHLARYEEALDSFDKALGFRPDNRAALFARAQTLSALQRFEEAVRDCEKLLTADPEYPGALGVLVRCRLYCCDWRSYSEDCTKISAALQPGKRVIQPFSHLVVSRSAGEQLRCAQICVADLFPPSPTPLWRGERYRHDKIRVAYLSADLYAHATAFLMAGVFEAHDKGRFETTAISFGPDDKSEMRARLEAAFDRFIDVRADSDADVAALLRRMEIDIAVDLKGFTDGARPGILAHRPAPVQAHYLGYAGTMGASYIDYLIADRIVIPEEARAHYAEKIIHLPDTYQCNDSKRAIGRVPARAEAGLPKDAFVFCCFNSIHKIAPEIFDIWMRLLARVEGSVLWLLTSDSVAIANLRREASRRAVAEERLIFAPRKSLGEHLARLSLADLFLDTLPYGAHTTASDALWTGLPVVTALGSTFAGRVAASLLSAAGLPELITPSLEAYETLALNLALDRAALAAIRTKLSRTRETCPLFDTARFTKHLEIAYATMWERHQRGDPPEHFAVDSMEHDLT
jgi:predicted O-linked N-acetylglucosamine transferase (SPINDLY family)